MAYGAILGQMPQIDGIPAVIETYPIATGNTITQGDVVDVVDGQIQKTLTPQANVETVFNSSSTSIIETCKLTDNFYICGYSSKSSTGHSLISVENNLITSESAFDGRISGSATKISICAFTKEESGYIPFIFAYGFSGISVKLVAGMTRTLNNRTSVNYNGYTTLSESSNVNGQIKVLTIDEDSYTAICIYSNNGLKARLARIDSVLGQSVKLIGNDVSLSGNTSASYISATRLPDSGTTRRVCVCYSDGGDSNKGKAVIVSIDESNNVTWGTPVVFANSIPNASGNALYVSSNDDNCVVSFENSQDSNKLYACKLSISGIAIVPSESKNISSSASGSITSTFINNYFAVAWFNGGTSGSIVLLDENANIVSEIYVYKDGTALYNSICTISNNNLLLTYAGDSNYGTATILTVSGNQIAGSFLDSSKDAIALQSGTSGQSIEVIYSGTVYADWVTAGQVINSHGVYGVGVLDGVLQTWSKYRPGQVVIGSYVGTGTSGSSNPTNLTFPFDPSLVIVQKISAGANKFIWIPDAEDCGYSVGSKIVNLLCEYNSAQKTLSWYDYSNSADNQLNVSGVAYIYIAVRW